MAFSYKTCNEKGYIILCDRSRATKKTTSQPTESSRKPSLHAQIKLCAYICGNITLYQKLYLTKMKCVFIPKTILKQSEWQLCPTKREKMKSGLAKEIVVKKTEILLYPTNYALNYVSQTLLNKLTFKFVSLILLHNLNQG